MTTEFLYNFLSRYKLGVVSSLSPEGLVQSALVGIAIAEDLRIIFDTVTDSRKYRNLLNDPQISLVVGWDGESTLQLEGIAEIPQGDELSKLKEIYYRAYPDGWDRAATWPNLTYYCIRPKWIRYSDFNTQPPMIVEMKF